jgi:hypothetical protein
VIGVAPREFTGMDQFVRSDFFVPLAMSPRLITDPRTGSLEARDARNLKLKGRLKRRDAGRADACAGDGVAARDRRRTWRLVRQLVTESLLLAVAGGVAGLAVGYAGMTLFRQIELPTDLPIALAFRMDRRALAFSLVVAVVSA